MASGLSSEASAPTLAAYDIRLAGGGAPELAERAKALNVEAHGDLAAAVKDADIVLSLVVGSVAVDVGRAAGLSMTAGQIYVDLNSISPDAKVRVAEALAEAKTGARFVEGAVMARVPPLKHKVPILLAGDAADDAAGLLSGAGMQIEVVGTKVGQACAVKMIRSVVVKGVEALLIESLTAAEKAGVTERILDSISGTFPGIDWRQTATYYIGRTHQHGPRRVTEMKEAAATLQGFGMEAALSRAISETIGSAHAKLKDANVAPDSGYADLLAALASDAQVKGNAA
jgi:3-hydroxyisobutyrate dehydrogenase-like beta-hydroxyacid dehydrogenase